MEKEIQDVIPPVVIPPTEGRDFDRGSYVKLAEHLVSGGVDGPLVSGPFSGVVFSTNRRRDEILRVAAEFAKGHASILVGVIDTETSHVKEHIRRAADLSADVVVVTTLFYTPQIMTEVECHFRLSAGASPVSAWAYDIPVCIHTKPPGDLLLRLGREGMLTRVKDSSGDDVASRQLYLDNKDAGYPLSLLTGHEVVVDGVYPLGADGSVLGPDNVDPVGYVRQWQAFWAGDWARVREEQNGPVRLMHIVNVKGVDDFGADIGSLKTVLRLLGIFVPNTTLEPVTALNGENVEYVRGVLREAGLLL